MNSSKSPKTRVLSGIQPSGDLHIGNYLGAIKRWVAEQSEKENYFCIVDMHAITVLHDRNALLQIVRDVAALYLACGLDPDKSTIFIQSHVPAHAECFWILNCVTPLGWLERMTQYKAKAAQQKSVGTGLLTYPVLQAADILLYDADEVPVGEDQKRHVELTRDIAQRFNRVFGETFVVPKTGARIRALNDPEAKMSKSQAHISGHAVRLLEKPDRVKKIFQRAVTNADREIVFSDAPEKAGVNNLLEIYELFSGQNRQEIADYFAGKGYAQLKSEVAEIVIEGLRPIRERYKDFISDLSELDRILWRGAQKAREVADPKVEEVKDKVGFIHPH